MNEKFRLNIFRKFLSSYILFLVITLVSGIISYRFSEEVITDSSKTTSLMMLNQSKEFVDQLMMNIQSLSKEISTNEDIANYVNGGSDEQDVYNTWKAWRSLAPYHISNNIIQNFYLYTNRNDVILTPQGAYVRPDDFYSSYHYTEMNALAWRDNVLNAFHQDEIMPSMPYVSTAQQSKLNVITYMDTITYSHNTATLVVIIDEREVQKLLSRNMVEYGGWVELSDGSEHSIASYGDKEELGSRIDRADDQDMIIIRTKSEFNGWTYTAGLSKAKVMSKANYIRNVMLVLLLCTTFVGLIIAFLFSHRNSAPLNEIARLLKDNFDSSGYAGKNGFDFLRGNVTKLVRNYHSLEEEMSKQIPVLREAYIGRLLSGKLNDQEIEYAHEQLGIQLNGHAGHVMLVHILRSKTINQLEYIPQMNLSGVIVRKVLEEILDEDIIASEERSDQYSIIWTTEALPQGTDHHPLNEVLERLVTVLSSQYDLSILIYVGGVFQSLSDIYRSHYEAKQAMEQASSSTSPIIWYEQLPTELGSLYYPIDVEMRLMSAVKNGELAETEAILHRIFEENLKVRQVNGEMFKQLIFEMKGTIYKIVSQSPRTAQCAKLREEVQAINPCDPPANVKNELDRSFLQLCGLTDAVNHHDQYVIDQIVHFLQSNYASPQLSLTMASDHVQFPEKQVSQLFKKHLGETFSGYLERLRIDQATALLKEGELTIEEIAERTGYNSGHAFRRAFKRVTGASPSMYRTISSSEEEKHEEKVI
ncbi:hypothetical protein PCCS19_16690 [Paenibacillus sp. CCS19]|uniref:helix-turn-helix domain-containing protein n=1 Tax=Paenibacillus sp. CCS19 TaxID=3158387 RepID=UPI00255D3BD9|nr:helix-turn-helix domain-containing protein [Paenibacillus cellulosilyticus]GMK38615.1 hypothetical protein PCCS19_16690 [Paenibacillus cellulosilyticus]